MPHFQITESESQYFLFPGIALKKILYRFKGIIDFYILLSLLYIYESCG